MQTTSGSSRIFDISAIFNASSLPRPPPQETKIPSLRHLISITIQSSYLRVAVAVGLALFLVGCGGSGSGSPAAGGSNTSGQLDSDGDGLTNTVETDGWEIVVDEQSFGTTAVGNLLTRRTVTSDPKKADSDEDGLDDQLEYLIRSDPRAVDTDKDGLDDFSEWDQWLTSPTSVDTDGDARGRNADQAPNQLLFDGLEVTALRTSPTLDDTDGDGRTDFEEFDDPLRSPLVSDLPLLSVAPVGEIDIRLNIEYAESVGEQTQYGDSLSLSTQEAQTDGSSDRATISSSAKVKLEYEAGPTGGVTAGFEGTIGAEISSESSKSFTSTQTAQNEHSRYETDSLTKTETASSGTIQLGLVFENTGVLTFEISNPFMTVIQYQPVVDGDDSEPEFRTLATLNPDVGSLTLAPGERTPVIRVAANDVNATLIKEFLANPTALSYETPSVDLSTESGIDFDFISEETIGRTAALVIDYGDGNLERYRFATNAARGPGAVYEGITMDEVLTDLLEIPYEADEQGLLQVRDKRFTVGPNPDSGEQETKSAWAVFVEDESQANSVFGEIVVKARQKIQLVYTRDEDRDGLFFREEKLFGTSDSSVDTDADGLTDLQEARDGWEVIVTLADGEVLAPEFVRSSPTSSDGDGDGLPDIEEFELGLDPTNPDTDGDGLSDLVEVQNGLPADRAAQRLYVSAEMGSVGNSGLSWGEPFASLQAALAEARARQATADDPTDDVSEVWVARGTYTPSSTPVGELPGDPNASFELVNLLAIYGGFEGNEIKRDSRDSDPVSNGTVLSGDLGADDFAQIPEERPCNNSYHVVTAEPIWEFTGTELVIEEGTQIDNTAVLDGFEISGGYAVDDNVSTIADCETDRRFLEDNFWGGGIWVLDGSPIIKNVVVRNNVADEFGGGMFALFGSPKIANSVFTQNQAGQGGGIGALGSFLTIEDSEISDNTANFEGGGIRLAPGRTSENEEFVPGQVTITNSKFVRNSAVGGGGGLSIREGSGASISNSVFQLNNTAPPPQQIGDGGFDQPNQQGVGGAVWNDQGTLLVVGSVFWRNSAVHGGGIYADGDETTGPDNLDLSVIFRGNTYILNSTFSQNYTPFGPSGLFAEHPTRVENSVFANRLPPADGVSGGCNSAETNDCGELLGFGEFVVRTSCIRNLFYFSGFGNVDAGPDSSLFVDADSAVLNLVSNSRCIDMGDNFVDYDPLAPGFTPLPQTDLAGNLRIVDGNGDGDATVDMGAYEAQE